MVRHLEACYISPVSVHAVFPRITLEEESKSKECTTFLLSVYCQADPFCPR